MKSAIWPGDNRLGDFTGGERHDCVEEEDGIGCDGKSGRISSVGAGRDDVLINMHLRYQMQGESI